MGSDISSENEKRTPLPVPVNIISGSPRPQQPQGKNGNINPVRSIKNKLFKMRRKNNDRKNGKDLPQAVKMVAAPGAGGDWLNRQRNQIEADCGWTKIIVQKKFESISEKLKVRIQASLSSSFAVKNDYSTSGSMGLAKRMLERQTGTRDIVRKGITKDQVRHQLSAAFGDLEADILDKLFDLMDNDKDGYVDETDFTVVVMFLLRKGTAKDNSAIAFDLFDIDKDGGISQQEFSEMIATVIGSKLNTILHMGKVKEEFNTFTEEQRCEESVEYFRDICRLMRLTRHGGDTERLFSNIPIEKAKELNARYIELSSPNSINISSTMREKIIQQVDAASSRGQIRINADVYEESLDEIIRLLESDVIPRFRDKIRSAPYTKITLEVWDHYKLQASENLNLEQFQQWSDDNPGVFDFLDEIESIFCTVLDKAAERWVGTSQNLSYEGDDSDAEDNVVSGDDLFL